MNFINPQVMNKILNAGDSPELDAAASSMGQGIQQIAARNRQQEAEANAAAKSQQAADKKQQVEQEALYLSQATRIENPEEKAAYLQQGYQSGIIDKQDFDRLQQIPAKDLNPAIFDSFKRAGFSNLIPEAPKMKQGTGDMSGYAFNPSTGQFSASEQILNKINSPQVETDPKTRRDINSDVTKMISDSQKVRSSAQDLDRLTSLAEKNTKASGQAAMALVYKFMKTLDPGSTVMQGEYASAEKTSGVPEAVRNVYNKLATGQSVSIPSMKGFVRTAQELANSAIDSSTGVTDSYLNTYGDTLNKGFVSKLMQRLPSKFEFDEVAGTAENKTAVTAKDKLSELERQIKAAESEGVQSDNQSNRSNPSASRRESRRYRPGSGGS